MRRGDKAAAEDEKAGVLLQSLQGEMVGGTSGEDHAESGLRVYLCKMREGVHCLWEQEAEILLP